MKKTITYFQSVMREAMLILKNEQINAQVQTIAKAHQDDKNMLMSDAEFKESVRKFNDLVEEFERNQGEIERTRRNRAKIFSKDE